MALRPRVLITAGVTVVLASALAAAVAPAADAATTRATAVYRITANGTVTGKTHLNPGRIKFQITGGKNHLFQIAKPQGGATKATLIADDEILNSQGGKPAKLIKDFRALGGVEAAHFFYQTLKPGKYFLFDVDASKQTPAKILTLTVGGKVYNAPYPAVTGEILAVNSMSFASTPKTIPAHGNLRFVNYATQWHFLDIEQLRKGKGLADVKKALAGSEAFEKVFTGTSYDTGVISPGSRQITSYTLPKGNYAIFCFFPDKNGTPHAFMGMYRTIKLT